MKRKSAIHWVLFLVGVLVLLGCRATSLPDTNEEPTEPPQKADVLVLLGAPTTTSIKVNVLSPTESGTIWLAYGKNPEDYSQESARVTIEARQPQELVLEGLEGNTRYYYRVYMSTANGNSQTNQYSFFTARPAGSTFTFTLQADSHLDENSELELYQLTLANVLADAPDFHLDLGDTFMCEKHVAPLSSEQKMAPDQATVNARYAYERTQFGLISHSVPLFLVNGNHEGEWGWINDGTGQNLAVWATLARQRYFQNPIPNGFYTGDGNVEQGIGQRAAYYAWQWGAALFIVLDPYWYTESKSNRDGWVLTLGDQQYQWLSETLATSTATFKFIFIHNLVGGLDGVMRGGIEAAPYFEWGGRNLDGVYAFPQKRPGWAKPLHQLLVEYHVTAVFHGHDHVYVKQELDGIIYQEVPQPSAKNYSSGPNLANEYHYSSGTIHSSSGHLRITVSPTRVYTEYVRAWLPKDQTTERVNRQVTDSWEKVINH